MNPFCGFSHASENGTPGALSRETIEGTCPLQKLATSLVAFAFAATLGFGMLSAPTVALSHPGNSCNPPAGHGRSGCHQVTASSTAAAQAQSQAAQAQAQAQAQTAPLARVAAQARADAKARTARARAAAMARAAAVRASDARIAARALAALQAHTAAVAAASAAASTQATPAVEANAPTTPVPWWIELWRIIAG